MELSNGQLDNIIRKIHKRINEIENFDSDWMYQIHWGNFEEEEKSGEGEYKIKLNLPCFICGNALKYKFTWNFEWYQGSIDYYGGVKINCKNSKCKFNEKIQNCSKFNSRDMILKNKKLYINISGSGSDKNVGLTQVLIEIVEIIESLKNKQTDYPSCHEYDTVSISDSESY